MLGVIHASLAWICGGSTGFLNPLEAREEKAFLKVTSDALGG